MSSEHMKQRTHEEGRQILRMALELMPFGISYSHGRNQFLEWVGERWAAGTDFDRSAMAAGMAGAIVALIEGGKE